MTTQHTPGPLPSGGSTVHLLHTVGPWYVAAKPGFSNLFIYSDTYDVAEVLHAGNEHRRQANARLIACAPELLRELQSAIFYIETYGGEVTANFAASGNLDAIKSIIRKAKGEA